MNKEDFQAAVERLSSRRGTSGARILDKQLEAAEMALVDGVSVSDAAELTCAHELAVHKLIKHINRAHSINERIKAGFIPSIVNLI